MLHRSKHWIIHLLSLSLLTLLCSCSEIPEPTRESKPITASFSLVAEAFDWGPASSKVILSLSESCGVNDLCDFEVTEIKPDGESTERRINSIYLSDKDGRKIQDSSSNFITIDMDVVPCGAGSIFNFNMDTFYNEFSDRYNLIIRPAEGTTGFLKDLHWRLFDGRLYDDQYALVLSQLFCCCLFRIDILSRASAG